MPSPAKRFVETSFGRVALLEAGASPSPPVLFVHGIPTSGWLWRHVLRFLAPDVHGYAPDLLGLGDSEVGPSIPLHMQTQASMLAELMETLGHESYGLVCHDQGGAAAQLLAAQLPERIRCFVITDCVCYDNWPVPAIRRLQTFARLGPLARLAARSGLLQWLQTSTPLSDFRRGVHRKQALTDEAITEYLRPLRAGPQQRARFLRFLLAGDSRYSLQAVPGLRRFEKPTLVIWAADDRYLSPSWGQRLLEDIPGAQQLHLVPFCGHFWQEERPAEFASLMKAFFEEHLSSPPDPATEGRVAGGRMEEERSSP